MEPAVVWLCHRRCSVHLGMKAIRNERDIHTMNIRNLLAGVSMLAVACLVCGTAARADTILWVDDAAGNIGQVDVTTDSVVAGSVHSTGLGSNLTDIGFNSSGTLYGTTFSGLYSINTTTGAATSLGAYNVGGGGMNALVGSGGTSLLAASGVTSTVYSVNPASPGSAVTYASSPVVSAGDLAFNATTLYESGIATAGYDELVNVSTDHVVAAFSSGGSHLSSVFGLADDGTTMYAVDGTVVYSVNLTSGVLTTLFNYGGHGLGSANGTAFIGEGSTSVPEPASLLLFGTAVVALGLLRRPRSGA